MTAALTARPRASALGRDTAMRLAATEYDRVVALLEGLAPQDWAKPTDCPAWDVRAVAAHLLGMAEMSASMRESMRQVKAAQARGGVFIDDLTDLQVAERAGMAPMRHRRPLRRGGPESGEGAAAHAVVRAQAEDAYRAGRQRA